MSLRSLPIVTLAVFPGILLALAAGCGGKWRQTAGARYICGVADPGSASCGRALCSFQSGRYFPGDRST